MDETIEIRRHAVSEPVVEVQNAIDPWALAKRLRRRVSHPPRGYEGGKRRLAKVVRRTLRVGPSRAAYLVDRLEAEGAIVYVRPRRGGRKQWRFARPPAA